MVKEILQLVSKKRISIWRDFPNADLILVPTACRETAAGSGMVWPFLLSEVDARE